MNRSSKLLRAPGLASRSGWYMRSSQVPKMALDAIGSDYYSSGFLVGILVVVLMATQFVVRVFMIAVAMWFFFEITGV